MARALRIEVADGWHHVTARGNERRAIFRDEADRTRFLELVASTVERHAIVVVAYVLMDNHYHIVLQPPLANLNRAIQWLNVSYSSVFNRRHRRSGHLFQGRFKSVLVDPGQWLGELARYVHLNPVRTRRLVLAKDQRTEAERGPQAAPPALVRERLRVLRAFRWSSYRAYAGYTATPEWLNTSEVLGRLGAGSLKSRQAQYRDQVEEALRQGLGRSPWDEVIEGAVLGTVSFLNGIKKRLRAMRGERHRVERATAARLSVEDVRRAVEQVKGERWEKFATRHGDSGRDIFLWLARRHCGLAFALLGSTAGGMSASAASEATRRVQSRLAKVRKLAEEIKAARQILNVGM